MVFELGVFGVGHSDRPLPATLAAHPVPEFKPVTVQTPIQHGLMALVKFVGHRREREPDYIAIVDDTTTVGRGPQRGFLTFPRALSSSSRIFFSASSDAFGISSASNMYSVGSI